MWFRLISPLTKLAAFLLSEVAMMLGLLSAGVLVPICSVTPGLTGLAQIYAPRDVPRRKSKL